MIPSHSKLSSFHTRILPSTDADATYHTTITTRKKARLIIDNGQMFYRQKKSDFFWITPIARDDIYFMDYDFEGSFLWIIGDNTDAKATAKGMGKVFKKQ